MGSRADAVAAFAARTAFFEDVIADWLRDPEVTLACGRWADGAVGELLPAGQARILPARYEGCFAGVREIRLAGSPHHLHIDLGRVHQACYAVAPSVCLDFKPSLEVRLLTSGPGGAPTDRWAVALMAAFPYRDDVLDECSVRRFIDRARRHAAREPECVGLLIDPAARFGPQGPALLRLLAEAAGRPDADWDQAIAALVPVPRTQWPGDRLEPPCVPLLRDALALRDASLVIYRDRTLVEFQTEKLGGIHRYEERGHVSWQIGGLRDHHCHLALGAVTRVLFSAEPVPCQGGGLNYTVWFLTPDPAGNPWRRDGYFSVVLNRPYTGDRARTEIVEPLLRLYRRHCDEPWVSADDRFLQVLEQGIPDRRQVPQSSPEGGECRD